MRLFKNKLILFLAALAAAIAAARYFGLGGLFQQAEAWVRTLGRWGPPAYVLMYAAGTVLAFPGSLLTVAAGSLFGTWAGFAVVSAGSTIGASLSFLLSRYFARDYVTARLKDNSRFKKLNGLTERHGSVIVAITRLVPLFHFTLLNYGFGLTRVGFRDYVLWSWLCMMPGTLMYVSGGDALGRGLKGQAPPAASTFLRCRTSKMITTTERAGAAGGRYRRFRGFGGRDHLAGAAS
jgi:uncharacterized membrane protein YdjX (TVP38/TMEM64 family)